MSTKQDLQLEQMGLNDSIDDIVNIEGVEIPRLPGGDLNGYQIYSEEDLCYCKRSILDGTFAFNEICSGCSGFEEDCWYSPSRYTK